MTRRAWFHCFSGIAGDMALGALVDAGADHKDIISMLNKLEIDDWTLALLWIWLLGPPFGAPVAGRRMDRQRHNPVGKYSRGRRG